MADKVKITIDGTVHEVQAGQNLLQICLDRGILVPHFCYHEALGAVGACRQCAAMVALAEGKPARLVMVCMTSAADGMVVSIKDPAAHKFRKGVIEQLMLNHPHDCPVCDEGGECMLQDMTVLCEHQHRRTRFRKRTWRNQYLGPFIFHEMNRCIQCYRCVRFYRDYALDDDLGVYGVHDRIYYGRPEEGVLESEFAGNLVDVCPTGVFTNKRFREYYCRPWDLVTARSVCVNCSVGCNVLPGARHQTLRRIKPAGNAAVNRFFMCDRGRFGGEYVNSFARLEKALVEGKPAELETATEEAARRLREIVDKHGAGTVAGIGSLHGSLETNAALVTVVGALKSQRVAYFGSDSQRGAARRAAAITASRELPTPSMPELEKADFVLSVGGDLTAEAPMLDLSVRQAVRAKAPVFVISPRAGKLDRFARLALRTAPGEDAALLDQVTRALASPQGGEAPAEGQQQAATAIAQALGQAKRPVILCSTLHDDEALVEAARALARAASREERKCALGYYYACANSAGAGLARHDESMEALLRDVRTEKIRALVIVERDVAAELGARPALRKAISKCKVVVSIDSLASVTTDASSVVLPCVSHYQAYGTFVNYEGRAQRFGGLSLPSPIMLSAGQVLERLAERLGAAERLAQSEFHHVYEMDEQTSKAIEVLEPGDQGAMVTGAIRPPRPGAASPPLSAPEAPIVQGLRPWGIHYAFGSEELSSLCEPVAELSPAAHLELNPEDADARGLAEGTEADFMQELGVKGTVKLNPGLARGTLGIAVLYAKTPRAGDEEVAKP